MVNAAITNNKYYPWLAWGCAAVFFYVQFVMRVSPGAMGVFIMRDLHLDNYTFGSLSSFYYVGYTVMQIIVGALLDKLGVRKPLVVAALLCCSGALIFATGTTFGALAFGRLLMGIGSAFGFLSCVKVATAWFPPQKLATIIGLSMLLGSAGGATGGAPLAMLVEYTSWQTSTLMFAAASLFVAISGWIIIRDPKDMPLSAEPSLSILESLLIIVKNPQTYVFASFGSLMYVPLAAFADLWGPSFVAHAYGVSNMVASGAVSMIYVGFCVGGPLIAILANYLQSYKKPLIVGLVLSLLLFILVIYFPVLPITMLSVVLFFVGLTLCTQIFAFACVCELNPKNASGMASGFHNMFCMLSGIIFQPILGRILDYMRYNRAGHMGAHSVDDYQYALLVIPISMVLALLTTIKMRELYPVKR